MRSKRGGGGGDTHSLHSLRVVSSALTQQHTFAQLLYNSKNGALLKKTNNNNNNNAGY